MNKPPPITRRREILKRRELQGDRDLRPILLNARDGLEKIITRGVSRGNFATSAAYRDGVYRAMYTEYVALGGDLRKWSSAHVDKIAREWHALAVADLARSQRKFDKSFDVWSRRYLRNIVELVDPLNAPALAAVRAAELPSVLGGMLQRDIGVLREAVVEVSRLSAASGLTQRQTRGLMLQTVLDKRKTWEFIDRSGKKWEPKNYFSMLNRTISNNVARQTYAETVVDAGHDLATIEGGIQDSICDNCAAWAGKIVSLTGKTEGYPTEADAVAGGVFHPRCRHYLGVVLLSIPGDIDKAKARELELREEERARAERLSQARERRAA